MDSSYLVIARRYRPNTFSSVIGQSAIIKTLKNAIISGRLSHAYLFAGPRGTGKTSVARLFAKAINCHSPTEDHEPCNTCSSCLEITEGRSLDVQEIDGASHRGIDHIRLLTEGASYAPTGGRCKIYIIDEVHMLTKEAFNALLKTLEEPPASVKFFLATTEPHKIPPTIISRCQRFNLKRLSKEDITLKLKRIVSEMNVTADEAALFRLAGYADGGLRDAESLLDQVITFANGHIEEAMIEEVLGLAPLAWFSDLDRAMNIANYSVAYTISDKVFHEGKDIGHFLRDLQDHYRTLLLTKLSIPVPELELCKERAKALLETIATITPEHIFDILNILAEAEKSIKTVSSQRFLLEWVLVNIVRVKRRIPLPLIARKLFELQEKLPAMESTPPSEELLPAERGELQDSVCPTDAKNPDIASAEHATFTTQKPCLPEASRVDLPTQPVKAKPEIQPRVNTARKTPERKTEEVQREEPRESCAQRRAASPVLNAEQEAIRQENLLQFASIELGAPLIKNPST